MRISIEYPLSKQKKYKSMIKMANTQKINGIVHFLINKICGRAYPFFVEIRLTYKCNLKCTYCNVWDIDKLELDKMAWFKIIDILSEKGCVFIQITGGEPLLKQNFFDILDYIHHKGIMTNIITNGTLIDKENINRLKYARLITFSLDGNKQTHDLLRGKGTFQKVVDSIELSRQLGINVIIASTINKYNVSDLDFMMSFCKEKRLRWFFSFVADYVYAGLNINKIILDERDKREFIRKIVGCYDNSIMITRKKIFIDYLNDKVQYYTHYCGKLFFFIEPDGMMIPCCFGQDLVCSTNLLKDGYKVSMVKNLKHSCKICPSFSLLGYNDSFRLNPSSIIHTLRLLSK
ncbi:MAG: radical SAM protein [Nanoarchaeota archaeon]|nr:radical SAM protein [Nanoarchaeota archaeon]